MMMTAPTLSVCLIVKDEAAHLLRALNSVRRVADETVVVDTGSADRTPEIAAQWGARVFQHPWRNDFSEARNVSLGYATAEWILVLGADEELETASAGRLKTTLKKTEDDGLQVCIRSFYAPGSTAQYGDVEQIRLFRNRPGYRFEQSVHEQIAPAILRNGGRLGPSGLRILHYGYMQDTAQTHQSRNQRNLDLLRAEVAAHPDNLYQRAMLGINLSRVAAIDEAEPLLQRVARAAHALPPEVMHEVLLALGSIAFERQNYAEAATYAQQSLDRPGPDALTAQRLLAYTQLTRGEQRLAGDIQPALEHLETLDLERFRETVQETRDLFEAARAAFLRLQNQAHLNVQRQPEIERGLQRCATVLALLTRLQGSLPA